MGVATLCSAAPVLPARTILLQVFVYAVFSTSSLLPYGRVGAATTPGTSLSDGVFIWHWQVGPIVPWWCFLVADSSTPHLTRVAAPTVNSSIAIAYASACLLVSLS